MAIVGRPNVGKSTMFNRLIQRRDAIVDESSGVTRDRHYGKSDWNGVAFSVIDTGGYIRGSGDVFEAEIRKQVDLAIDEADVILFMVDVETGVTDLDQAVAEMIRRSKKKVVLAVNKVDNYNRINDAAEFYGLGLGEYFVVSSINGTGTGDLLDQVVAMFDDLAPLPEEEDIPKIAIVGRPNAGKSTLVNTLLQEERNIVTDVAGTTRDTIYTRYNKYGHDFLLVDTAGIRKKGKVHENIEFYSVMRAIRAIEYADVCLLIVDAKQGFESQDLNVLHLAQKNKKGIVILVNKWDLVDKETYTAKQFEEKIRKSIEPFRDVPVLFISALQKQRIHRVLELAQQVYENRLRRIKTSVLNSVMLDVVAKNRPPAYRGKYIKIKYVTQLKTRTPQFVFFCNFPKHIRDSYRRYLENKLREHFDFTGAPVQIYFRQK